MFLVESCVHRHLVGEFVHVQLVHYSRKRDPKALILLGSILNKFVDHHLFNHIHHLLLRHPFVNLVYDRNFDHSGDHHLLVYVNILDHRVDLLDHKLLGFDLFDPYRDFLEPFNRHMDIDIYGDFV